MKPELQERIKAAVRELYGVDIVPQLERTEEQFGDYATNVALQLAGQLHKNPREIADAVSSKLQGTGLADAAVAGPGFINLKLDDQALARALAAEPDKPHAGKTVVIETNNPNPFKAMHIGHAFNAVVADTIANLLETGGAAVHRVSYHGDVGLHVGKSMYSLLRYANGSIEALSAIKPEDRNVFMSRMYAEGSAAYKDDPEAKAEIDMLAEESFNRSDPLYAAVYDLCLGWSFEQIDTIVAALGNRPVERRFLESEADSRGVETVRANTPGVFLQSDGALVFPGSQYGSFDNVFVSSKGRGLYGARDLGLIQLKNEQFHPSASYIVTAEEQRDYFKGVIAAAELAFPDLKGQTINIPTGTVKLSTGKMSSRSGDVVTIEWLFDRIAEAAQARGGQPDQAIIAGALRYQLLKVRVGSDVVFDVAEAVSLEGNSGPYLQYAHARAQSILRKAGTAGANASGTFEPVERSLARKISEYPESVSKAVQELMPHHVCTYLYELAQAFNRFYEHNRVIGDPREAERLDLVATYARTLREGLGLLGISAPDQM